MSIWALQPDDNYAFEVFLFKEFLFF